MRILAINPPITDFAAYDLWSYPLGLLTICGYLEWLGVEIQLMDCRYRYHPWLVQNHPPQNRAYHTGQYYKTPFPKPSVYQAIDRPYSWYGLPSEIIRQELYSMTAPDYILLTGMMTYWYPAIQSMVTLIRETYPRTPLILGGIYPSLCYDHAVGLTGIDLVVTQSSLQSLFDLIGIGSNQEFQEKLPGITPSFHLYSQLPSAAWMTSQGCPFQCSICASPYLYHGYRPFPPIQSAQLLTELVQKKHIRDLAFYDDALLYQADDHFIPFIQYLISRRVTVNLHTPNGLHVRYLTLEIARLMVKSRFKTIRLSLESAHPHLQNKMDHKISNPEYEKGVESLLQAGYRYQDFETYLMIGIPGQSLEQIMQSILYLAERNLKINLASYSPIPHSAMFQQHPPTDPDPLLQNHTIYYYQKIENRPILKKIRNLVSLLNRSVELDCNIFYDRLLKTLVEQIMRTGSST